MVNNGLVLARKIYGCYPNEFNSFLVVGKRGIGKTSYSLKVLHEVFMRLGYGKNKSWQLALDCLKFSIPDVISYLKEALDTKEKKVCLVWDDLRVYAGGGQYFMNMKLVEKLKGLLDTVRTATSSIIMTAPAVSGLLGILRSYDDYQIKISYSERGGMYRVAKGYLWSTLPSGQRRVYKKFEDNYRCYLPNHIYRQYMVYRENAFKSALSGFEETAIKK